MKLASFFSNFSAGSLRVFLMFLNVVLDILDVDYQQHEIFSYYSVTIDIRTPRAPRTRMTEHCAQRTQKRKEHENTIRKTQPPKTKWC